MHGEDELDISYSDDLDEMLRKIVESDVTTGWRASRLVPEIHTFNPDTQRVIPKKNFTMSEFFGRYRIEPRAQMSVSWLVVINKKTGKPVKEKNEETGRMVTKRFWDTDAIMKFLTELGKIEEEKGEE